MKRIQCIFAYCGSSILIENSQLDGKTEEGEEKRGRGRKKRG